MPAAAYQLMLVYDYLEAPDPAPGILLDRLWPRGIAKEKLAGVLWEKDATPSAALRAWFHADSEERYPEFCTRFAFELQAPHWHKLPSRAYAPSKRPKAASSC